MDYSRFRFKAVVDWIEIEIRTLKHSNFHTVQDRLKKILRLPEGRKPPYINAIDKGAGGSASIFRLRIYDPQSWQQIAEILGKLAECYRFTEAPKVTAIEVALDAYRKGEATNDELAELVADYYRHITYLTSSNRRLYRDYKGSAESMYVRRPSLARKIKEGRQIGIGNTTDELYQHAYLKTTDNGKALPISKHRARLEIRLQGAKIQNQAFEKWGCYSFTSLSKFFKFRKPKDDLKPRVKFLADISFQIGEKRERNTIVGRRLYSPSTLADTKLNRRAYDALRELSRRWKS